MKRRLFTFALAALTIGLLGSCSKINERIDGLDKRVYDLENEKIASIENQIAAINQSIADLETIRTNIQNLKNEQEAQGQDITDLQAKDQALEGKINDLRTYVDTELSKYATTEWANATFATLKQLKTTNTELGALKETVGKLGETFDGKLSDLKTKLTNAITSAIDGVNASISALEARVSALEQMIQSVSITPAYSDGSVEAVDSILTLKCIVSPAEALIGMESLKDSLLIYADSVKVKTKGASAYMEIEVSEASVLDAAQGAITLTADISEYLPKGEDKALTVAVNIKNGISFFTTEFVPVYVCVSKKTFKAVYDTNGGANTLTFYYDANDHSGEGITVYEDSTANFLFDNSKSYGAKWGYNGNRGSITSVVIDASVAGYKGLTSTASMFQGMTKATGISGAEYLDVSNVTDMSWMFQNFGGGASGSPTTLNSVPDVSGWDTGKVTNMAGMFWGYGNFSSELDKVPDVSGWNTGEVTNMSNMFQKYGNESQNFNAVPDVSNWDTGNVTDMANIFNEYGDKSTKLDAVPDVSNWKTDNVTNMQQMFYNYGIASINISCVLDLSGWDLSKITGTNGVNVFNFNPKTFDVTIPAKTGEKSNEGGKWYYGDGTNHIAPPAGNTFTLLPAGALKGVFSVSATKKVHFSQGNLYWDGDSYEFEENQYAIGTWNAENHVNYFFWSKEESVAGAASYADASAAASDVFFTNATAETAKADFTVNGVTGDFRTLSAEEWTYILSTRANAADLLVEDVTVCGVEHCLVIAPDACLNSYVFDKTKKSYDAAAWATAEAAGLVCLPPAGYRDGAEVKSGEGNGFYWASSTDAADKASNLGFKKSDN